MDNLSPLSAERYRLLVEALPAPVFMIGADQLVAHANPAFLEMIGLPAAAVIGHSLWDYWPEEEFAFFKRAYNDVRMTKERVKAEFESLDDGSFSEVSLTWSEGYVIGMLFEVTSHRRLEQDMEFQLNVVEKLAEEFGRLNHQALDDVATDSLTGVGTRRRAEEVAAVLITAAQDHALKFAFIAIDLDHFKVFNDRFGHLQGDKVLRRIGAVLREFVSESETAARLGGEEFLILCPGVDTAAATLRAEELLERIREIDDMPVPVTASIGVAPYTAGDTLWTHVLARADRALYAAKNSGRNRVVRWTPTLPAKPALPQAA